MKYFLIAGEPSGDMHAASLMAEIKNNDSDASFCFLGGDLMKAKGGELVLHYSKMAFMGILPVLLNIRTIRKNFKLCEKELIKFNPDLLILVDYPGFNLRMAKFAKANGFKTAYYISPKLWAWKTKRVYKVKAYVDKMYTIFPFETEFYNKYNYQVNYVGNPINDLIKKELQTQTTFNEFCKSNNLSSKPIIALLAGSRKHEIQSLLPIMEEVAENYPDYQFIVAGAPGFDANFYSNILTSKLEVVYNQTYKLLRNSNAAIVASGTATFETALLNIPQIVVYKMGLGWLLSIFRKFILKTKHFSLVNLVAEKEIVKELFQGEVKLKTIQEELNNILNTKEYRMKMLHNYSELKQKSNTEGAAIAAANLIVQSIKKHK